MIPPKSCNNCESFKKKELLTKDNQITIKEYCQKFHQELFSHKACQKFIYNKELDLEVETPSGNIAGFSGAVLFLSSLGLIISLFMKSILAVSIFGFIAILSMISLIIFMKISDKIEKRVLYGKNEKEI